MRRSTITLLSERRQQMSRGVCASDAEGGDCRVRQDWAGVRTNRGTPLEQEWRAPHRAGVDMLESSKRRAVATTNVASRLD